MGFVHDLEKAYPAANELMSRDTTNLEYSSVNPF